MSKIYDLIIIGGGCAGLTAGIYGGRAKLRTLLLEKSKVGGQVTTTSEVVNYPGFRKIQGSELMEQMRKQAQDFGVEIVNAQVTQVDFQNTVKKITTNKGEFESYGVIIATGAVPRKLGIPGEKEFTGRGIAYCSTCDGEFFNGLDIFVVGAGYAAAEEAIYLTRFGRKVTVIAREPEFTCAKTIADKVLAHPKIEVKFHTELLEVSGDGVLQKAVFQNNQTGETFTYHAPKEDGTFGIFIFVGYQPASEVFKGQVNLDRYGYIPTDETLRTNVPGVYAAGDLRPKALRQIVTAVCDGAIAATSAEHDIKEIRESLGIEEDFSDEVVQASQEEAEIQEVTLGEHVKAQLLQIFEKLTEPITIKTVVDKANGKTVELQLFLEKIASLSPKVQLESFVHGENMEMEREMDAKHLPVAALYDKSNQYTGVCFHGIPGGHELNSFVLAIYNLAGPGQPIEEPVKKRIMALDKPVQIKVCVSLSCHFCPDVVAACQRIAALNPHIQAAMFDMALFPSLKKEFKIMSVPAILLNDKEVIFGAKSLEEIVEILENYSSQIEK